MNSMHLVVDAQVFAEDIALELTPEDRVGSVAPVGSLASCSPMASTRCRSTSTYREARQWPDEMS
jgi:hypothetical protein